MKNIKKIGFLGNKVVYLDIERGIYFISGKARRNEFKDEYELRDYIMNSRRKFYKISDENNGKSNNPFCSI